MNIVLLGATGFVGGAILRQISRQPGDDIKVNALIRKDIDFAFPFIKTIRGDLFNVHFAIKQIDKDGKGFYKNNVRGTQHMLEKIQGNCLGIIYGSSMSVYGEGRQVMVSEDTPLFPATALARSRAQTESLILSFMEDHEKWALCLRPRFIIGEGDKFTMNAMVKFAQKGLRFGSGNQKFNLIDVDDYAGIITDLCRIIYKRRKKPLQAALNIGYEQPISYNEWIQAISGQMGILVQQKKVPVSPLLIKLVRCIPSDRARKLATKLELVGLDHTGTVNKLFELIDKQYTKSPLALVKELC